MTSATGAQRNRNQAALTGGGKSLQRQDAKSAGKGKVSFPEPAGFLSRLTGDSSQLTATSSITVTGTAPTDNMFVLNGLSTYGGGTTVSGGTLKIGNSSTFAGSAVTAGPIGIGSLTLANGVAVDPGGTNRALGASTFFVNGNVNVGNAATAGRLLLDGAINLGGGTRTLTLFRNGTAATELSSGNEAFKLVQLGTASTPATVCPGISLANGTLRLVADASVTTTYTVAKFDILTGGSPVTCTANSGLTIGNRVIAAFGNSSVFGTGTDVGPKLTFTGKVAQ